MLKKCKLQSIISLPQGVFLPYTGVKTNVVYLTKVKKEETKNHFWYFDVKNDGYSLDNNRRKLDTENDIERFLANRKIDENNKNEVLNIGFELIPLEKISQNDYILTGYRYREFNNLQNSKWDKIKLGEIGEFINGYAFKPADWKMEGKKIIRIQNLTKSNDSYNYTDGKGIPEKYIVKSGDLLISWSATIGFYIWNAEESYLNQHIFKVDVDSSKISKDYLYFIKDKIIKIIEKNVHGGTMQHITKGAFENIEIPLPPLDVQLQIVDELANYQRIIDGAKMVIENYKPNIEIDPKWKIVELGKSEIDIIDGDRGTNYPSKEDFTDDGYCLFLNTSNVRKGFFDFSNVQFISKQKDEKLRKGKLSRNDVVLTTRGTIGNIAHYSDVLEYDNLRINSGMVILRPNKEQIISKYLVNLFLSFFVENQIDRLLSGTAQPQLPISSLSTLKIPIPPLEIQQQIVTQIETEQALVESSKKLIEVFTNKIADRINQIWGS